MSHLEPVVLPVFGSEPELPVLPLAEYEQRLEAVVHRMQTRGLDFLLVYGDREHFANLAFLTGFDPRFEEAMLLLDRAGRRALLVGNECLGYLPDPALGCEVVLYQELSLLGQPRSNSLPLRQILSDFGIRQGKTVGTAGWKYFEADSQTIEIPAYVVDLLRELTGDRNFVTNAGAILMDPQDGLRCTNSAAQIAQFEFASCRTSGSVLNVLHHLQEGVAECDLETLLSGGGLPQSCHPMISFGDKVRRGLASPSARCARRGDPFVVAYGIWGALTCRAGAVAKDASDLADGGFYQRFVGHYFDLVTLWYRQIRIGAGTGPIVQSLEAARDDSLLKFAVNPGHLLHLDEWVHSPFTAGSRCILQSGMALQMDMIPVSQGPFCYSNAEDGVVLADAALRDELAADYPGCWERMQTRRRFMSEAIGIELDAGVLPLSNIPAWLPPFALDLEQALVAD